MRQNIKNTISAGGLLIALGITFGDIGTSPLYVMKAIVGDREIGANLILGGISCIFWTLVIQTTLKYVWLTLRADNDGEGGIFALYSLVKRNGRYLAIPTMLGAAALLADGIIMPAISVTAAVEGLNMLPWWSADVPVVPIVIGILSCVFLFQRLGTQRIGQVQGPMMVIWFGLLLVVGIGWVIQYPSILAAVNPQYAYRLLVEYPDGFWLLGAVFLCTTGAEALYSDLGHCGRENIRITWGFVKTALVVNYMGQGAWLLYQNDLILNGRNPLFEMMPEWFLPAGIAVATIAAVIASQALISGSFTLINEAMNLNFWTRVSVRQPSEVKGQIYIPSVNLLLWIGCIFVVLHFRNSADMEGAYGLAITVAMLSLTVLLGFFLRQNLGWKWWAVAVSMAVFGGIELMFFIANLAKFANGGYITVLIGGAFFAVMYVCYYARKVHNKYLRFVAINNYTERITALSHDKNIPKFATHLVYLTKANKHEQIEIRIMESILAAQPKRADVYWLFHINRVSKPYTLNYEVMEIVHGKMIKVQINVGFRIRPLTELYFNRILRDLSNDPTRNLPFSDRKGAGYNTNGDYLFVLLHSELSIENEFTLREGLLMKTYFLLHGISQDEMHAFGLNKNNVRIEQVPLVYQSPRNIALYRKK